ncbi:FMN-binding negative transcriptional regulator [Marinicrinis sediminis]|uniref:FMN-binding negative transcriptional regulator n=1 Tax=Marinicrinis sediminis TaxID=1652465 RepID=A0ABW5R8S5_9BACL
MYIPAVNQVNDPEKLADFITTYSFGILFSQTEEGPWATHLPFVVKRGENHTLELLGHMAKVNPHWSKIREEILVVFQGPHAYISPTWYGEKQTAPTWNYTAVHAYGRFECVDNRDELIAILEASIEQNESRFASPWRTDLSSEENERLMEMVMGFRIQVHRLEGNFKLNQHHTSERKQRTIAGLRQAGDPSSMQVADWMEQET